MLPTFGRLCFSRLLTLEGGASAMGVGRAPDGDQVVLVDDHLVSSQ